MAFVISSASAALIGTVAAPMIGDAIFGDNGQGAANEASANAANSSAAAANKQAAIAQDQWDTYKAQYSPVNMKLAGLATAAGSPEQIDQEGAIAGANATQQTGLVNAAKDRALLRSGVNPNSGNALALAGENANNEALLKTGAVNTARKTTQDAAFAKTLDTVNAGNRVASNATAGLSSATAGLSAASNANANVATNAANAHAQFNDGMAGLGKAAVKWLNSPAPAPAASGVTTSLGSGFYNPNGF